MDASLVIQHALEAMDPGKEPAVPPSPEWMSEDPIAYTQRVWTEHKGREVGRGEAVEMLSNVKWLAVTLMKEVLRRQELEAGQPEGSPPPPPGDASHQESTS
ncbi:MAG: hypothetical protein M5U26_11965 [Planctomycetota bacterium]|nr:hypothetical protein [Planctomycetota bacterium]